ncbi:MAG: Alanine--tRNA ligase [bacterium ADurb.Bin212]|jgi:alanyl-tRNA synthetase|nr:MAG: Alanine--tRNA ligase [bacterium ADurb.Bin212]
MKPEEIRQKFLKYFESKGHKIIPSASLIPAETDPTVLFTTAGMHPLVPYLMGDEHPKGKRLVNVQRCIRTGDIDEVGDESHLTFFEMMGYWSLGDYWKKEAIEYIFEFLTKELGLNPKDFAATCFEGDEKNGIARDTEAYEIWRSLGIPEERITYLGYEDNWWGPAGNTGPCGPDSELFVWVGEGEAPAKFDPEDKGWMELCNDVFMQYNKTAEGKFEPLVQKNVDFGMGFERLVAYLNKESDIYKSDQFWPIIEKLEELSNKEYHDNKKEFRVIVDHLKAAVFVINDGVAPSNKDQGYVARRLIRRSIVKARDLGLTSELSKNVLPVIFECHSELDSESRNIYEIFSKEESKFINRINSFLMDLEVIAKTKIKTESIDYKPIEIDGKQLFDWYQSEGVPLEISLEEAQKRNIKIEKNAEISFYQMLLNHKELSRTASAGMFKGGLADAGEETKKLHTAAHLMLEALRRVLGDHVMQKGSNITAERLRFDFSHPEKMTDEQKKRVEDIVNEQIKKDLTVTMEEMTVEEADKLGAMGAFKDRYGERVKVYSVLEESTGEVFSKEICGGPHVEHTGELGHFMIKKEESSSSGIRRIKAVLK